MLKAALIEDFACSDDLDNGFEVVLWAPAEAPAEGIPSS
jgi:hypothetical protein